MHRKHLQLRHAKVKELIVLCGVILCLCCCSQPNVPNQICFYNSDGTWYFSPPEKLINVSSEKVYVADDMSTYSVFSSNYEWGILHSYRDSSDIVYEEQLIFDSDELGRPMRWPSPSDNAKLLVVKDWLVFYVFSRNANALHLCKVRIDGSDYYEFINYEFRGDSLLTDGASVYSVCRNTQGDWVPFQIDPETNQAVELSTIPLSVRDNLWFDCEKIWWVSIHDGITLLYSVPFNSGEVTSYPIENVEYVGANHIFYKNDGNALCSKNIEMGKTTTWDSTKEVSWDHIIGSSSQGILLYTEKTTNRTYWFLNFRSGNMDQVSMHGQADLKDLQMSSHSYWAHTDPPEN